MNLGIGGIDVTDGLAGAVIGMLITALGRRPLRNLWHRVRGRAVRAVPAVRAYGPGGTGAGARTSARTGARAAAVADTGAGAVAAPGPGMGRTEPGPAWRTFSLGPLHTSALLVEGDGETAIAPESVRVEVGAEEVSLPPDMAPWRDEVAAESARLRAEGGTPPWNGPRYAVESFAVTRTALDERPEVRIRLRPTDYYTFLAAQQLDRRLPDGATPRSRYLDPARPWDAPAFLQCSFAANVAVVTADGLLVVSRRSAGVRMAPDVWNSSVNEGLSRHADPVHGRAPGLHALARRGMREELSVEPHEYTLALLAFVLDTDKRHWSAHFLARLTDVTREDLEARMSRGVADRWEHQATDFVPFRPEEVADCLLRADRRDRWAPLAPALFHLALVHVHGRAAVERAEAQAVRRLRQTAPGPVA